MAAARSGIIRFCALLDKLSDLFALPNFTLELFALSECTLLSEPDLLSGRCHWPTMMSSGASAPLDYLSETQSFTTSFETGSGSGLFVCASIRFLILLSSSSARS